MPFQMNQVASIILGGGQGTRLFPLTAARCKPAISFGGRYRIIDVPISNSLNSNIHKIFIVTQFLSANLHRHILDTYRLSYSTQGFIELLGAEQKPGRKTWFEGTADAVRKNLEYFQETPVDYFLILSGDQLYNLDFQKMLNFAMETDSDLTIATLPIKEQAAKRMGVMKTDDHGRITHFHEKPQSEQILQDFKISNRAQLEANAGLTLPPDCDYLGSMGIYAFKREALFSLLEEDRRDDFGSHLIPTQLQKGKTSAFLYTGYWEDIGTIESYYHANIALTQARPELDVYDEPRSIYTCTYHLPGPKISQAKISNSIICEGAIVEGKEITNSILGTRAVVQPNTTIRNSYVVGNDFYTRPTDHLGKHLPKKISIGEGCRLEKVILDKNVCIGDHVQLVNREKIKTMNGKHGIFIRDGIIVVPRSTFIPNGFVL